MIVRIDEPRGHELAGGVDNFNPTVGCDLRRDPFDDPVADQKVGGCGLGDVAIMGIYPSAANQVARGGGLPCHVSSCWRQKADEPRPGYADVNSAGSIRRDLPIWMVQPVVATRFPVSLGFG